MHTAKALFFSGPLGLQHIEHLKPVFHAELLADVVSVVCYLWIQEALSGFGHQLCTNGQ